MAAGKVGVVHTVPGLVEDISGRMLRATKTWQQELEITRLQRAQKIVILRHRPDSMSANSMSRNSASSFSFDISTPVGALCSLVSRRFPQRRYKPTLRPPGNGGIRCKPPRDATHGIRESRFRRRRLRDLPCTGDVGMSGAFRPAAGDGGKPFGTCVRGQRRGYLRCRPFGFGLVPIRASCGRLFDCDWRFAMVCWSNVSPWPIAGRQRKETRRCD